MEMKKSMRYEMRDTRYENGSALILVVVLTSLLAIVGVMFVMVARVDRIATSAISENKTLDSAVEAVIARISQELVLDVPRPVVGGPEYYDYPGPEDRWLASLEPHKDGTDYEWRQISDVTGFLERKGFESQSVEVELPNSQRPRPSERWVRDYPQINVDEDGDFLDKDGALATEGLWADADGDGVADSKWIELEAINSSKGKTIYAAIRVIDNGGMLNVNTAYQFNPDSPGPDGEYIDGSDQMQINLLALSERGALNTIEQLDNERFGTELHDMDNYLRDVVWRYNEPNGAYTPFDISDELALRDRFILNEEDIDTRAETLWTSCFQGRYPEVPIGSVGSTYTISDWFDRAQYDLSEPNATENYSYRHIGTTYNMDRIINPVGVVFNNGRMVNVNKDVAGLISVSYTHLRAHET